MKILNWLKDNFNFVSLVVGLAFVASGHDDIGKIVITQGAAQ